MDIDAVITWVDGNDPKFRKRRNSYLSAAREDKFQDIGGDQRFVQSDEIKLCVASIIRFAPFIKRIFIITDGQIPDISDFLTKNFGEDYPEVNFVDHHDIFVKNSSLLPVFNSLSIESMMSNIPGLSQRFVYFNDDFFLLNPIKSTDWFTPMGIPIVYASIWPTWVLRVLRYLKPRKHGHKVFGFKDSMLNAALITGSQTVPVITHTPHAMLKSGCQAMLRRYSGSVMKNVAHRFRHPSQFNPQVLYYLTQPVEFRNSRSVRVFLKPQKGRHGYIKRKLKEMDRKSDKLKFGCINSVEQMSFQDKKLFENWICRRLNIKL
ncbi:MAG: hypothetical protein HDS93_00920 [Bacteroidales bacterium]|nr:hypothetical protein [Bacteroidales bacterium]MBD5190409.1 hypothetical protein [Bacteroidales bacterium]